MTYFLKKGFQYFFEISSQILSFSLQISFINWSDKQVKTYDYTNLYQKQVIRRQKKRKKSQLQQIIFKCIPPPLPWNFCFILWWKTLTVFYFNITGIIWPFSVFGVIKCWNLCRKGIQWNIGDWNFVISLGSMAKLNFSPKMFIFSQSAILKNWDTWPKLMKENMCFLRVK